MSRTVTLQLSLHTIEQLIKSYLEAIRDYDKASLSGHKFPLSVRIARNEAVEELQILSDQLTIQGIDAWILIKEIFNKHLSQDYLEMRYQHDYPIDTEEEPPF